jgi:hypothetical protein
MALEEGAEGEEAEELDEVRPGKMKWCLSRRSDAMQTMQHFCQAVHLVTG